MRGGDHSFFAPAIRDLPEPVVAELSCSRLNRQVFGFGISFGVETLNPYFPVISPCQLPDKGLISVALGAAKLKIAVSDREIEPGPVEADQRGFRLPSFS